jgi:hypothetical protein
LIFWNVCINLYNYCTRVRVCARWMVVTFWTNATQVDCECRQWCSERWSWYSVSGQCLWLLLNWMNIVRKNVFTFADTFLNHHKLLLFVLKIFLWGVFKSIWVDLSRFSCKKSKTRPLCLFAEISREHTQLLPNESN